MIHHRIFYTTVIKTILAITALIFLFLPILSCGFNKQAVIHNDFSKEDFPASALDRLGQDDMMSTLAETDIMTRGVYYPAKIALVVKRPSYIRLELLPLIGVPDFLLAATPEQMNIFLPSRGEVYNGRPTSSNLKKFLPWSIDIEDMVMIFTGTYPSLKEQDIIYQGFQEDKSHRWEMKAPSGNSQTIWIGEHNQLSGFVRKDKTGEELYHVKYVYADDHADFPEKITIHMGDGSTSLSIKYSDVKIEKSADLSAFHLVIPAHVKSMTLE